MHRTSEGLPNIPSQQAAHGFACAHQVLVTFNTSVSLANSQRVVLMRGRRLCVQSSKELQSLEQQARVERRDRSRALLQLAEAERRARGRHRTHCLAVPSQIDAAQQRFSSTLTGVSFAPNLFLNTIEENMHV